jgi:hypothetical protein
MEALRMIYNSGYDKKKNPEQKNLVNFDIDDIRNINNINEFFMIDNNGNYRNVRKNGQLKTWKRDKTRFEQSFKYGLYENFRLTTKEMLNELYKEE